jgi:solute carrier family 25 phosphate transporter 3
VTRPIPGLHGSGCSLALARLPPARTPLGTGWFKFGGVEFFKINLAQQLGPQGAWDNRNSIYLGASAMAEFIADIFLCPLEATRIRLVSNPTYASGLFGAASRMAAEEGLIGGFYSGFIPILFKQIPYTMCKFAVQGRAAEAMYSATSTTPEKSGASWNVTLSLASGVIAGVASAIISHPADTLLSKVRRRGPALRLGGSAGWGATAPGGVTAEVAEGEPLCSRAGAARLFRERASLSRGRASPSRSGPHAV